MDVPDIPAAASEAVVVAAVAAVAVAAAASEAAVAMFDVLVRVVVIVGLSPARWRHDFRTKR